MWPRSAQLEVWKVKTHPAFTSEACCLEPLGTFLCRATLNHPLTRVSSTEQPAQFSLDLHDLCPLPSALLQRALWTCSPGTRHICMLSAGCSATFLGASDPRCTYDFADPSPSMAGSFKNWQLGKELSPFRTDELGLHKRFLHKGFETGSHYTEFSLCLC